MFEVVKGYAEMYEADEEGNLVNPDAKLAVTAVDDKTLTVTLNNAVAYWNELLAFHLCVQRPVRHVQLGAQQ